MLIIQNNCLDLAFPYDKLHSTLYGTTGKRDSTIKPIPEKSNKHSKPSIQHRVTSLEKALSIIELVLDQDRALSITEISQKLGMGKGTVHRILSTLKARKFFQQDSKTKMYSLGVRTLEIGMSSKRERFLCKAMVPFLMDLAETCRETVNAAVWEYNEIRYIYRLESEEMLRISTCAGARFPGYCAATGKIFLSYFSDDDIRQIYGRKNALKKYTKRTIGSVGALIQEMEKVRVNREAVDDEETLDGVYCVAAPILNSKGECVAAISISAPKNRVPAETAPKLMKLVSETARKISGSLREP
jgi:IclR family transcriptional regulator, KDG regulon repressor